MERKWQVFWDAVKRDPFGHVDPYANGSRMYREGGAVIFECYDFDREDGRRYDYRGQFPVEEYRNAIAKLQQAGHSELQGEDYGRGESRMEMRKQGDYIELVFSGIPSPSATPGGTPLSGSVHSMQRLATLLLQE